ncbi:C45 family peptidase [Sulfitobacter sp. D35]|uniref:C45 family peptidase n=1 Tax=Sulfitobacter sp. D35 TaxID=3083252 RepID=UPI00296E540C|nr:C45 family peptidase [Sulfitobacter sp. D35]MDW4497146.1 C45 family peptidase [Sulfitobacter sp. D35]
MSGALTFEAVDEARPGRKWLRRWNWSWPDYEAWFTARGGDRGPSRAECEAALRRHMPELVPIHAELTALVGTEDRAARFLSGWCPPAYLGGCSLAAHAKGGEVRLVRNYDLSPDLNEGFLLKSAWRRPVMGMVEFLWGLSDGINDAGLAVALAFGGRGTAGRGFGITHIVRYLLETCDTVGAAEATLARLPSHMAYNLVLADASGRVASLELAPGGGVRRMDRAIATNHQHGTEPAERPGFTRTIERRIHLAQMLSEDMRPSALHEAFLAPPLYQRGHAQGFGTLFTADYDPARRSVALHWPEEAWGQSLDAFTEGRRTINYDAGPVPVTSKDAFWVPPVAAGDAAAWIAYGLKMATWSCGHRAAPRAWPDAPGRC